MSLGLLVWPAVVGFLFLAVRHETRFGLMRLSGYQVIFISALTGLLFLVVARFLILLLDGTTGRIEAGWKVFAPFDHSGALGLGVALALAAAMIWNRVRDRTAAARRVARRSGSQIVWLLLDSLAKSRMVEVTLRSNKAYVGYAQDTGITTHRIDPDIALIPMASGYRDKETRELELTTFYGPRIAGFLKTQGKGSSWKFQDFQVAIPFSEIISARLFDPTVYEMFRFSPDDTGLHTSGKPGESSD